MWFGNNLDVVRQTSEKQKQTDQWASKMDEQLHRLSDPKDKSKFVA